MHCNLLRKLCCAAGQASTTSAHTHAPSPQSLLLNAERILVMVQVFTVANKGAVSTMVQQCVFQGSALSSSNFVVRQALA